MNIKHIHIKQLSSFFDSATVVKKKRERTVYHYEDLYIKVWVPNWTQGDITKYCVDSGYYDESNASALQSLIYDESGQRGYITNAGQSVGSSWKQFSEKTNVEDRKEFMKSILANAILTNGIYSDLFPTNFVFSNRLSLIDFDSFSSFTFLFDKKKQPYEKFDLNAWWKPHETAVRDVNKFYRAYFETLGLKLDFSIDSVDDVQRMISLLDSSSR